MDRRARGGDSQASRRPRSSGSRELYAERSPALIRCGWGLERNRNGGNAAMAVLALPAVGGKFGVRGGGYSMSNSASWNIDRPWIGADEPDTRIVNMNHLGRALTEYDDPPVKVLFVYNCNPAATVPDQRRILHGLEREDLFTVVFEQVMTDTALYADLVLPATTFLEGYDFAKAYGPINLELARTSHRRGRAKRDRTPTCSASCAPRLGLLKDGEPTGELDLLVHVLDALPGAIGDDLRAGARPAPPFGAAPIQFVDVFPNTPDRKVDLFPEALEASAPLGLYRYQPDPGDRALSAGADLAGERAHDQLDARRAAPARRQAADASRRCAAERGLADGDLVRIFNELGEVHCTVTCCRRSGPAPSACRKGSGGAARATA